MKELISHNIVPNSNRNGSVMRAVPIGVMPVVSDVISYAIMQASTTHCTLSGINGAVAVALAAHYYYHDLGSDRQVTTFIQDHGIPFHDVEGPVPCEALHTAYAAIKLSFTKSSDKVKRILRKAVMMRGDTDSVAAVALGLASLRRYVVLDYPDALVSGLSSRNRRSYQELVDLDKALFKKYPQTYTNRSIQRLI